MAYRMTDDEIDRSIRALVAQRVAIQKLLAKEIPFDPPLNTAIDRTEIEGLLEEVKSWRQAYREAEKGWQLSSLAVSEDAHRAGVIMAREAFRGVHGEDNDETADQDT